MSQEYNPTDWLKIEDVNSSHPQGPPQGQQGQVYSSVNSNNPTTLTLQQQQQHNIQLQKQQQYQLQQLYLARQQQQQQLQLQQMQVQAQQVQQAQVHQMKEGYPTNSIHPQSIYMNSSFPSSIDPNLARMQFQPRQLQAQQQQIQAQQVQQAQQMNIQQQQAQAQQHQLQMQMQKQQLLNYQSRMNSLSSNSNYPMSSIPSTMSSMNNNINNNINTRPVYASGVGSNVGSTNNVGRTLVNPLETIAVRIRSMSPLEWQHFYKVCNKSPLPSSDKFNFDFRILFCLVLELGGVEKVNMDRKWDYIVNKMNLSHYQNSQVGIRNLYNSFLLQMEGHIRQSIRSSVQQSASTSTSNPTSNPSIPFNNNVPPAVASVSSTESLRASSLPTTPTIPQRPYTDVLKNNSLNPSPMGMPSVPTTTQTTLSNTPSTTLPITTPNTNTNTATFTPKVRKVETFGGLDARFFDSTVNSSKPPDASLVGSFDVYRIIKSLECELETEIHYVIDATLMLSCKKNTPFPLMKFPSLCSSLLNCCLNSLACTFGSPLPLKEFRSLQRQRTSSSKSKASTYVELFESEWNELQDLQSIPLDFNEKLIHSERAISLVTCFRNFTFSLENATYLASHPPFAQLLDFLVVLDVNHVQESLGINNYTMSIRESHLLEHYKNVIVILSNIGSHHTLSKSLGSFYIDLLVDFLSIKESIYSYLALEALAKLTLVQENVDVFTQSKGLDLMLLHLLEFLPGQGLLSDATPEMIASWELGSLLLYNLSFIEENHLLFLHTKGLLPMLFRIISSGLTTLVSADYIQIITLRCLKTLHQLVFTFPQEFRLYESTLVELLVQLKVSGMAKVVVEEVGTCLSECILNIC